MHDVLRTPELLDCILDHLVTKIQGDPASSLPRLRLRLACNPTAESAERRTLVALARTCRSFSDPALNALWYNLETLNPLLQCSRTTSLENDERGNSEPLRPFNEEEWSIVSRYAPRVRELSLWDKLSMKILQSLWAAEPDGPRAILLPNLRKLEFQWDLGAYDPIRLLLGSSLRHLKANLPTGHGNQDHTFEFLECFHTFCPNLRSLHFGHYFQGYSCPGEVASISRAVLRFPNLETLTCHHGALNEEAFLHFAKSCYLRVFSAVLFNHSPDSLRRLADHGTADSPPFKNLRDLDLRVRNLSSVTPYLKSYQQPFEDVSFEFLDDPSPEVFYEFFTALNSPRRRETLRRIKLEAWRCGQIEFTGGVTPSQVDFEALSPLSDLNLHAFEVNLYNPISLNDDELVHLVQGWSGLEIFRVNPYTGSRSPTSSHSCRPTLLGLLHLLSKCQKLRCLALCVDATTVPSLTDDELNKVKNKAIEVWEVTDSLIERSAVASVARFLHEHFPSVTCEAVGFRDADRRLVQLWQEVDKHIDIRRGRGFTN